MMAEKKKEKNGIKISIHEFQNNCQRKNLKEIEKI